MLGSLDFGLERGERLGIIGENGTGKSTFLKTVMGIIPKLGGKYTWGNRVEIGYFDQNVESLNGEDTVLEVMQKEFPLVEVGELRNMLGSFEFYGDMVFQNVSSLSGGQKVKLLLCKIMRHQPNVLILDEPTNHLDIIGKETIEKLLLQYKGTVIFVSHDRYFVRKIATNLLVFEGGKANYYKGDYNYYLSKRESMVQEEISNQSGRSSKVKKKYTNDFKEKSKLERQAVKLENEIQKLEEEKDLYHKEMLKEEVYMDINRAREVELKIKEIEMLISNKMQEWEEIIVKLED